MPSLAFPSRMGHSLLVRKQLLNLIISMLQFLLAELYKFLCPLQLCDHGINIQFAALHLLDNILQLMNSLFVIYFFHCDCFLSLLILAAIERKLVYEIPAILSSTGEACKTREPEKTRENGISGKQES